jgi:hypothetical protein
MDLETAKQHAGWVKKTLGTLGITLAALFVLAIVGLIVFRIAFVDFVDNYEIGYRYDTFGPNAGKIQILPRTGYFVTYPFRTKIHTIDGRPMQVCISAIKRVLNCKLVEFNPTGINLFLQWHGRNDYENNGGTTTDGTTNLSQFNQILMNYAYDGSGRNYPFLTILRELKSGDVPQPVELPR